MYPVYSGIYLPGLYKDTRPTRRSSEWADLADFSNEATRDNRDSFSSFLPLACASSVRYYLLSEPQGTLSNSLYVKNIRWTARAKVLSIVPRFSMARYERWQQSSGIRRLRGKWPARICGPKLRGVRTPRCSCICHSRNPEYWKDSHL